MTRLASPYRSHERPQAIADFFRLRYWPSAGVIPLLFGLLLAAGLALLARHEDVTPSTIVCTTARSRRSDTPCVVHDAQSPVTMSTVPCDATPAALDAFLATRNPLARPRIEAVAVGSGAEPPAGATDPNVARELLAACVREGEANAAVAPRVRRCDLCTLQGGQVTPALSPAPDGRVLQLMIYGRNDTLAVLLFVALALLTVAALGRSSVETLTDVLAQTLRVQERGWLGLRIGDARTREIGDVLDVVVGTATVAGFTGRRVEVVLRSGGVFPLTAGYFLFTARAHRHAARHLRTQLFAARAAGPSALLAARS